MVFRGTQWRGEPMPDGMSSLSGSRITKALFCLQASSRLGY